MVINPILPELSIEDFRKRYEQTFVRYNHEVIYINRILPNFTIEYTKPNASSIIPFDYKKLDISRPSPRWVKVGKNFYYIFYLCQRQWVRGFSQSNTVIVDQHMNSVNFPNTRIFKILEEIYSPSKLPKYYSNQVLDQVASEGGVILSPQVFILLDNPLPSVFFREKCIGYFGKIPSLFVPELNELIGDYVNENNVC